jgi:hypothetical protein
MTGVGDHRDDACDRTEMISVLFLAGQSAIDVAWRS